MIYIYYAYINEKNHNELIEKYLLRFPREYQQKILSYHRWQDAQLSLMGRLLLMCGMKGLNKGLENFELEYTEYNKPIFSNLDLKFNISHSGNLVLCAISEVFDIGVDVELMNDLKIENFRDQMTVYEWRKVIQVSSRKTAFYEYWTQKEAVVKAHGKGLSIPLKSFEILNDTVTLDNDNFYTKKIELDAQYKIALAYKKSIHDTELNLIPTEDIKLIALPFLTMVKKLNDFFFKEINNKS